MGSGPATEARESAADLSPTAKTEVHQHLLEDLAASRHASDGGGRVSLRVPTAPGHPPVLTASSRHRFELTYEVGPRGIADGGTIFFQPSPFWGWDPAQVTAPDAPGFCVVESDLEGVSFHTEVPDGQQLVVRVQGRSLKAGERFRIVYGAGPARARVDRYAERESPLWVAVDGDGDGVRAVVAGSPAVEVVSGPPGRLVATLPASAEPGESVRLNVALLDSHANRVSGLERPLRLRIVASPRLGLPATVTLGGEAGGSVQIEGRAEAPGVYHVRLEPEREIEPIDAVRSNPLIVRQGAPRVLWADLHGHSNLSDGTGTPEDYYRYARDVAALDAAALTDHDHWGVRFLDQHPAMWRRIRDAAEAAYEPGRFVTLLGYEWTSWLYGHRHVLYFHEDPSSPAGESAQVFSAIDAESSTPDRLWDALRGQEALTFAHHSAGGPVATSWAFAPDPVLEPVTEIVSVHGSSEAADSPAPIAHPAAGNYVRDVLGNGWALGFIGSGDGHDGHPGLAGLQGPSGGLAAILTDRATRQGVLEALRERRVYATNGPRIWLSVLLDGQVMGSLVEAGAGRGGEPLSTLVVRIAGTAGIDQVAVVRSGGIVQVVEAPEAAASGPLSEVWSGELSVEPLRPGEFLYVRVVQDDGGAAWSSPFFGRAPEGEAG